MQKGMFQTGGDVYWNAYKAIYKPVLQEISHCLFKIWRNFFNTNAQSKNAWWQWDNIKQ